MFSPYKSHLEADRASCMLADVEPLIVELISDIIKNRQLSDKYHFLVMFLISLRYPYENVTKPNQIRGQKRRMNGESMQVSVQFSENLSSVLICKKICKSK